MKKHEQEAYDEYVRSTYGRHRKVAVLVSRSAHEADDLVQTVLLNLYRHWPRVSSDGSPDAYVRTAIRNEFKSSRRVAYFRREDRREDVPDIADDEDALLADLAVDHVLLGDLLPRLPDSERLALVARFYFEYSILEVADYLDCSDRTAKRHIARGLNRLRAMLDEGGDGA